MLSLFLNKEGRKNTQKHDVERRRGRGKERVVKVVSKRRRLFGRRVPRCRGETRASEIEFERCEILVRSEYGDEKVGEEIISCKRFEEEV